MYTKTDKIATKIAYVQDKVLSQPPKLYTGMPVMPVTNCRSACGGQREIVLKQTLTEASANVFPRTIYKLCNLRIWWILKIKKKKLYVVDIFHTFICNSYLYHLFITTRHI